jgi:uncharacterized membrane protein
MISRLSSIDIVRGIVMVIMALDHVRDYLSSAAFDPTDLSKTNPALFFTRWITHFCAPVFVLLAGSGAALSNKPRRQLSWFLLTRGLWLVFLEIAVITPMGWSFNFSWGLIRLQVIWVIGWSMLILSGFVWLPVRASAVLGLAMICGHDWMTQARAAQYLGPFAGTWKLLHDLTFNPIGNGRVAASLYPLVPWAGVLLSGYALGQIWKWPAWNRRRFLFASGAAALALFVILRASGVYGDPAPWNGSFLSFLNVSKYPPSLDYLLLTLGPALIALAAIEAGSWSKPFEVFGRVPMFYYLLHLPLIHGLAVVISYVRYGSAAWLFRDPFGLRRPPNAAPADYGFGLPGVYLIWIAVVIALYPACRWYAEYKRTHTAAWLSYL